MKNKNLLIVGPHFVTFIRDQVLELCNYFKQISVISPEPYGYKNLKNLENLPENLKVYFPKFLHLPISFFRKRQGDNQFRVIDSLIKKEKIEFDLIHCHFTWPSGYVGAKLKEKYGRPLVVTIHENRTWFLEEYKSKNPKLIYTWKTANFLIRVNEIDLPLLKKYNSKSICIPNGFDKNKFYPLDKKFCREKINLPLNKKILLTIANLVEQKGHKYMIDAMKKIVKKRRDVLYIVGGSGPLKKKLQIQVNRLNLQNYIKFIGFVPNDKINIWMNACDLFVLPSLSESFGVVQIETLACGKPVVATRNGGSEEIITSEDYGLLCEPANPDDLAEKILIALDKKWDRNKILKYSKKFMWSKIVKDIVGVYEKVLK